MLAELTQRMVARNVVHSDVSAARMDHLMSCNRPCHARVGDQRRLVGTTDQDEPRLLEEIGHACQYTYIRGKMGTQPSQFGTGRDQEVVRTAVDKRCRIVHLTTSHEANGTLAIKHPAGFQSSQRGNLWLVR